MPPKKNNDPASKAGSSKSTTKDQIESSTTKGEEKGKGKAKATKTAKSSISAVAKATVKKPPVIARANANYYGATNNFYQRISEDGSQGSVTDLALLKLFPLNPTGMEKDKFAGYKKTLAWVHYFLSLISLISMILFRQICLTFREMPANTSFPSYGTPNTNEPTRLVQKYSAHRVAHLKDLPNKSKVPGNKQDKIFEDWNDMIDERKREDPDYSGTKHDNYKAWSSPRTKGMRDLRDLLGAEQRGEADDESEDGAEADDGDEL